MRYSWNRARGTGLFKTCLSASPPIRRDFGKHRATKGRVKALSAFLRAALCAAAVSAGCADGNNAGGPAPDGESSGMEPLLYKGGVRVKIDGGFKGSND